MKRNNVVMARNLLSLVLNHMLFMVISITGLGIFGKDQPNIVLWGVTGLIPIALFFVRIYVKNFLMFYGIHLGILLITWILPLEQIIKVMLLGNMIVYVILSVRNKMFSKAAKVVLIHPAFFFVVTAIMSLWEIFVRNNKWEAIYIGMTFSYLIIYMVYYFVQSFLRFIELHEKNAANIPEQEMFISGIKQTGVYAAGSVFILWITLNLDWFSKMMRKIGDWIVELLRSFFSQFDFQIVEEAQKPIPEQMEVNVNGVGGTILPPIALMLIEVMATIVAIVGVVALVVVATITIYRFLREHFLKIEKEKQVILQSTGDIREQCQFQSEKKERKLFGGFLDNRGRVRKLFRKTVIKQKKKIIGDCESSHLKFVTAKECCERIGADQLQVIYEKARYSAEDISAEDIRKAKES